MNDFTADQAQAITNLKVADNLLALARYSVNRQDLNKQGLEWVSAPDVHGALVAIANAIELLEDTKSILTEEDRKRTELLPELLGEKAGIVSIPDSFWKPYDDYKEERAKQA